MKVPSLDELNGASDEELISLLGLDAQIKDIRSSLEDINELEGEALEYAKEKLQTMLTPRIDNYSFRYIAEDAERMAKGKDIAETCGCCPKPYH